MSWGLADEMEGWECTVPSPLDLLEAIFASPLIEFNRIRHFQDVTMRLVGA